MTNDARGQLPADTGTGVLEGQHAGTDAEDDTQGFHHLPIRGYTGYPWDTYFGGLQRDQYGRSVYIGVFPRYQAPAGSGPYPGLR
jgi:hypothetical protein